MKKEDLIDKAKIFVSTVKEKVTSDGVKEGAKLTGLGVLFAVPLITYLAILFYGSRD